MPTYDYLCNGCGHKFEHFQSMSSAHLRTCPECKKRKLKRLIGSGAGVIFKGSGFYQTDYKKKSGGGASSVDSSTYKDDGGSSSDTASSDGTSKSDKASDTSADKPSKKKPAKKKAKDKSDG